MMLIMFLFTALEFNKKMVEVLKCLILGCNGELGRARGWVQGFHDPGS